MLPTTIYAVARRLSQYLLLVLPPRATASGASPWALGISVFLFLVCGFCSGFILARYIARNARVSFGYPILVIAAFWLGFLLNIILLAIYLGYRLYERRKLKSA